MPAAFHGIPDFFRFGASSPAYATDPLYQITG
jgi:hypothetical protein